MTSPVNFMFARVGCIGQPPLRISDLIRSILTFAPARWTILLRRCTPTIFSLTLLLTPHWGNCSQKRRNGRRCKQLLLLPKYLKLTNVALADTWHTSEGNVRRWREEIASSIDEAPDRFDFCSGERLAEIQEILKSPTRENVAGDVVHIRSREHGRDDKWDYYREHPAES